MQYLHLEIGNFMENWFPLPPPPPKMYDQQSLIKRDSTSSCHVWVLKGMGDLLTFQTPSSSSSQVNCGWKVAVSDYWFADHAGWSGCPSRQASISILAGAPMEEGWEKDICLVQILGFSWASSKPQWALGKNQWVPIPLFAQFKHCYAEPKIGPCLWPPFLLDFKD